MVDNAARLGATFIMWTAMAVMFGNGSPNTFAHELLVPFVALATLGIWIAPYLGRRAEGKAKRHATVGSAVDENEVRLRLLMEMLDDEEKARIRTKLMNGFSDGELPVDEFLEEASVHSQL